MKKILFVAAVLLLAVACGAPAQKPEQTTKPAATPVVMGEQIDLQRPAAVGGATINEALWNRKSERAYVDVPLTLEELSGVVWAAAGINRPENDHLTAPSAMGLYPIRTYAFFKEGIYRYDARENRLVRVLEGDYRAVSGAQPFVATAPLNLVFVADMSVYDGRNIPVEHVRYLCGQDAAGYVENVNLYAAGHGLKAVTRGSASPELLQTLGLDPARYLFALAVSVGK